VQNTIFALLPYLGLWVIVMSSGGGADRLQSHGVLSTTATRKIMQLLGQSSGMFPERTTFPT